MNHDSRVSNGPAVLLLNRAVKISRAVKRLLMPVSLTAMFGLLIALGAIATPLQYRIGLWQRLPILDHRLLPHLSALFAAAFGAFFGSLSAFYLGRVQQRSDRREKRHAALIAAQYALMSQWNIVEAIRVQHLEDLRNDPSRFTKLKLYWFPMSPSFVPFADLTFVLETKDPNILQEIHLAEQSYRGCAEAYSCEIRSSKSSMRTRGYRIKFETSSQARESLQPVRQT